MQPRPDHGRQLSGKRSPEWAQGINYRWGFRIGRAVAIAYAREGADVAINYLPEEEDDAREVVDLIKKAGRNVLAIPGDIRDEAFAVIW